MYSIFIFNDEMDTSIEVAKDLTLKDACVFSGNLYLVSGKPVRVLDNEKQEAVISYFNV